MRAHRRERSSAAGSVLSRALLHGRRTRICSRRSHRSPVVNWRRWCRPTTVQIPNPKSQNPSSKPWCLVVPVGVHTGDMG